MSTTTTTRTIHTGCPVADRGNGYGFCRTHLVRVYLDGHDWHVFTEYRGGSINVLDQTKSHASINVTLTCPRGATDEALAEAAGFESRRHFGFAVSRYDDGTAVVSLWTD